MDNQVDRASDAVPPVDDGVIEIGGRKFMQDAKGNYVPLNLVKPADKLKDEAARKMLRFARDLSAQIARFKGYCYDDINSLQALLAQEYGADLGGKKGNVSFTTLDATMRVSLKVSDLIEFGPELQAAKSLVDACLTEWSEGSRDEIRALVTRAFSVDKEGAVNRTELFMLMRVGIADARWQRAMDAIRDSIQVIGSKSYLTFEQRASTDGKWEAIPITLARA